MINWNFLFNLIITYSFVCAFIIEMFEIIMETLIKIDSNLLEKAMTISNNKSEKLIAEEALRNYILMNNIFNKALSEPQIVNNTSNNSELLNDFLELIEKNKYDIKKINKNINLSDLANEVNNDIF